MNKLFRPKCLRRVLLCLAMLFPIVYLCGGLFFALSGAHGENVLATEETSIVDYRLVDFNQQITNGNFDDLGDWRTINSTSVVENNSIILTPIDLGNNKIELFKRYVNLIGGHKYYYSVTYNSSITLNNILLSGIGNSATYIISNTNSGRLDNIVTAESGNEYFDVYLYANWNQTDNVIVMNCMLVDLTQAYGSGNEPTKETFLTDFPNDYYDYTLSNFYSFPIYGIPSEQNSLFFHVFGQRNFISQLGIDLVNGSQKGFNPMNELFRTINTNILHFEDTDGLAMFGLGYVYYAVNVLIIYEVLILAVKLIMLPLRAVELFDKKEDI